VHGYGQQQALPLGAQRFAVLDAVQTTSAPLPGVSPGGGYGAFGGGLGGSGVLVLDASAISAPNPVVYGGAHSGPLPGSSGPFGASVPHGASAPLGMVQARLGVQGQQQQRPQQRLPQPPQPQQQQQYAGQGYGVVMQQPQYQQHYQQQHYYQQYQQQQQQQDALDAAAAAAAADAPSCLVQLQTPAQLSLVCEHAATLSALSGANFWLQPGAGAGGAGSLALSGSQAQLQAAGDLIAQLLSSGSAPQQWQ
jgi:hypothetical protein